MRNATVYLQARLARMASENEKRWVARATRGRAILRWSDGTYYGGDPPDFNERVRWASLSVAVSKQVAEEVRGWLVEILKSLRLAESVELLPEEDRRETASVGEAWDPLLYEASDEPIECAIALPCPPSEVALARFREELEQVVPSAVVEVDEREVRVRTTQRGRPYAHMLLGMLHEHVLTGGRRHPGWARAPEEATR